MNNDFILFPAIDLRGGQVVRLAQGDPARQTAYSNDPAQIARRWLDAEARWLHVVNLDGAFGKDDARNQQALQAILKVTERGGAKVQYGGGLHSLEALNAVLEMGVARAVLGTLAVLQPLLLKSAIQRWSAEHIAASLDCRNGQVTSAGWQQTHPQSAVQAAQTLAQAGLRWLIFTDIAQDGLQTGLNLPATLEIAALPSLRVIASGGVGGLEDVRAARRAGLAGVIAGRALYEGTLDLKQALAC